MKTAANAATKPAETQAEETKAPMSVVNNEPATEQPKELSLEQRIQRVENLQLLVTKRSRLIGPVVSWRSSRSHPMISIASLC